MYVSICFEFDNCFFVLFVLFDKFSLRKKKNKKKREKKMMSSISNVYMNWLKLNMKI